MCTGCSYCNGCPKGIEIPKFMDAYNYKLLTGDAARIEKHLGGYWDLKKEQAKECIACGKCERACTQHLPIIERLREIAAL